MAICASPELIAACHVLHRRRMPRHPPCALVHFQHHLRLSRSTQKKEACASSPRCSLISNTGSRFNSALAVCSLLSRQEIVLELLSFNRTSSTNVLAIDACISQGKLTCLTKSAFRAVTKGGLLLKALGRKKDKNDCVFKAASALKHSDWRMFQGSTSR